MNGIQRVRDFILINHDNDLAGDCDKIPMGNEEAATIGETQSKRLKAVIHSGLDLVNDHKQIVR